MLDHAEGAPKGSTPPSTLADVIREVRSRWRLKLALRGAVRSSAVAVVLFFAAAYALEWARFSATSIIALNFPVAIFKELFFVKRSFNLTG